MDDNTEPKTFAPPAPAPDLLSVSDLSYVIGYLEGYAGVLDDLGVEGGIKKCVGRLRATLKRLGVPE